MKLFKKESKIEKEEYFSFCVEGIYKHKNGELFVLGIVDGIIQKLDSLFLIGPYGYEEKVEIQEWIEVDSKQNYYALLIDQRFQEEIDQGYIFTNKNNHLATSREEVYNPYLQFLLDQVNRQHYDYLDILFEQLATSAYFLAVFDYQDFPIYQIIDKKYYPIYTSQLEMNKDQKCKNKKAFLEKALPSVLVFGIVTTIYGVIDMINSFVKPVGIVDTIANILFLIVLVGFLVYTTKLKKQYF